MLHSHRVRCIGFRNLEYLKYPKRLKYPKQKMSESSSSSTV